MKFSLYYQSKTSQHSFVQLSGNRGWTLWMIDVRSPIELNCGAFGFSINTANMQHGSIECGVF